MSEHHDFPADVSQDDQFEKEMRGYSRRQVDEFVARARSQARELENRKKELSRALGDNERLRLELSSARQAFDEKPAHAEISERVGQILKLADDEAQAQKSRAAEEIMKLRIDAKEETDKLRANAKQETERFRTEAKQQAERMLGAAQEQAQNSVAAARTEAEKTRAAARTEAERSVGEAHKQADTTIVSAKAQAKQLLDEATARATAIHDGAERRLNLLMSRHSEALRRLTEIRDVVTGLVAGEVTRGSLEDEVAKAVASSVAAAEGQQAAHAGNGTRAPGMADRHAPVAPGGAALGPLGQQAGQGRDLEAERGARARAQAAAAERPGTGGEQRPGEVFRAPAGNPRPAGPARAPRHQPPASTSSPPPPPAPRPARPASPPATSQPPGNQPPASNQPPAGTSHPRPTSHPASNQRSGPDPGRERATAGLRKAKRQPPPHDTEGNAESGPARPGDGAKHAAGTPSPAPPLQRP